MLVIKTQQQIGTPEYMNISYINKEICRLFGVQPDDDKSKDIGEPAIRLGWNALGVGQLHLIYIK